MLKQIKNGNEYIEKKRLLINFFLFFLLYRYFNKLPKNVFEIILKMKSINFKYAPENLSTEQYIHVLCSSRS